MRKILFVVATLIAVPLSASANGEIVEIHNPHLVGGNPGGVGIQIVEVKNPHLAIGNPGGLGVKVVEVPANTFHRPPVRASRFRGRIGR